MTSLKRQLVEGVFLFSSTRLIVTLLNFITAVVLIRNLGIFEYGLFVLAFSFYTILSSFLDPGVGGVVLSDASAAFGEKKYSKVKTLLKSYAKFEVFVSLILFLVLLITSFSLRYTYGELVLSLLVAVGVYIFTTSIYNSISEIFHALSEFRKYNAILMSEAIFKFILTSIFIGILEEGILFAMYIYIIAQVISLLIVVPSIFRVMEKFKKYPSTNEPLFTKMIASHGKWVIFYFPLKKLGSEAHYWIVQLLLGVNAVALLGAAMRGLNFLKVFLTAFQDVLFPLTASVIKNWKKAKYMITKSTKYNLWIAFILCIPTIVFAPLIVETIFSGKYINTVPVFRILLPSLITTSLGVIKPLFYALKKQKYLFYAGLVANVLLVILDCIFITILGLVGVGISMFIASFTSFLIKYRFIKKFKPDFALGLKNIFWVDEFDKKQLRSILRKISCRIKYRFLRL